MREITGSGADRRGSYRWEAAGPGFRAWGAGVWEERFTPGRPGTAADRSSGLGGAVWWVVRLAQLVVGAGAAAGVVRTLERSRGRALPAASRALPKAPRALPPGR